MWFIELNHDFILHTCWGKFWSQSIKLWSFSFLKNVRNWYLVKKCIKCCVAKKCFTLIWLKVIQLIWIIFEYHSVYFWYLNLTDSRISFEAPPTQTQFRSFQIPPNTNNFTHYELFLIWTQYKWFSSFKNLVECTVVPKLVPK